MPRYEYTKEHIKSSKLALLIGSATAAVADIFVVVLLMIGGLWSYVALPIVLALADIAFLVVALFTNFRFRYSITYTAVYLAVFIGCVLGHFFVIYGGAETAMTALALIIWVGVHILNFVVTLFGAKGAVTKQKGHHLVTALLVVLFIGTVGLYIGFGSTNGYFGQGSLTSRPILYIYNEKTNTYTASGVLSGSGQYAVIPEEFDGKPVSTIDASIFNSSRLERLEIKTNASVELINLDTLENITVSEISASRDTLTTLQREFYTAYRDGAHSGALQSLASICVPSDLQKDEVYITFAYSDTALSCIGETFLPSWIGKKGDTFHLSDLADNIDYIVNTDSTNEGLLHQLYNANTQGKGYIMLPIMLDESTPLNGTKVQKSHQNVTVDFEKIYRVEVLEDNDTLYTMPQSFTSIFVDGADVNYRYVTPSTIENLLPGVEQRDGFTISWDYTYGNGITLPEASTSCEDLIYALDNRGENKFTVTPTWTLSSPKIESLTTNKTTGAFTYGDRVDFDVVAEAPANGTVLTYDWYFGDTYVTTTENYEIPVIMMDQGGEYTVKVTASSNTVTSLTSVATKTVTLSVSKKEINISWNGIEDLAYNRTYDSFSHNIGISFNENDLVTPEGASRDSFTYEFTQASVKNAGTYTIGISLTGEADTKYVLRADDLEQQYIITPKPLTVSWSDLSLTYNAELQKPTVTIEAGVCSGDDVVVTVTAASEKMNAGTYDAFTSVSNANYIIEENSSKSFTISKKPVNITWDALATYAYNKTEQGPTPKTTDIEAKDQSLGVVLTRIGAGTHAGDYTAGVTINSENYMIVTDGATYQYTIIPKTITVEWASSSLVYNSKVQIPQTSLVGVCDGDTVDLSYNFLDNKAGIHVGEYTVSATSQNANYQLSDSTYQKTFNITKAQVYVEWSNRSQTYAFHDLLPSYEIVGVYSGDTVGESVGNSIVVSLSGAQTNAGTDYPITMSYTSNNYEILSSTLTTTLTINRKEITLSWGNNSFVYNAEAQIPTVTIAGGAIADDNVTVSASGEQVIPGNNYKATATLSNDNYYIRTDHVEKVFTISKKALTPQWSNLTFQYDRTTKNPTVTLSGIEGTDDVTFTISEAQTNAGTHTAKVTLSSMTDCYYLASDSQNFTIEPHVLIPSWSDLTLTYDGNYHSPTVTFDGTYDGDTVTPVFDINSQRSAGTYTFNLSINNTNYVLNTNTQNTLTINPKVLVPTWSDLTFTYDGNWHMPNVTFESGVILGDSVPYAFDVTSQKNVGEYTYQLIIKNSDYTANINTQNKMTINRRTLTVNWTQNTFTFENKALFPSYTISGFASGEDKNVLQITEYNAQTNVGSYTTPYFTYSNANYTIAEDDMKSYLVIEKRKITLSFGNTSLTYNGTEQHPSFTFSNTVSGYSFEDKLELSGKMTNVGEGTFTVSLSPSETNYTIDGVNSVSYSISPLDITLIWYGEKNSTSDFDFTYNGALQVPTVSTNSIFAVDKNAGIAVSVSGEEMFVETSDYTATAGINSSNYNIVNPTHTFKISPKKLLLNWSSDTLVYNGQEQHPTATISNPSDICGTDVVTVRYLTSGAIDAGNNYEMTVESSNPNYTFYNPSTTYSISKARVTVVWTGSDGTSTNFEYTYNGSQQIPSASATFGTTNITLSVTGATTDTCAKNGVSYYTAQATTGNENFTLNNATCRFTIVPKALNISWNGNATYTYNGLSKTPTATITDGVCLGGDYPTLTYTYRNRTNGVSLTPVNAGLYSATAAVSDTNYALYTSEAVFNYTISEYEITEVYWEDLSLSFTGNPRKPTAYFYDINNQKVYLDVTVNTTGGSAIYTGTYTAVASLPSTYANNYVITSANATMQFVITNSN